MTLSRREIVANGLSLLPVTGLWLGLPLLAAAQSPPETTPRNAYQGMGSDPLLAACLFMKGRRQIEVCRFAKDQVQNDDLKAFLQAEVEEHETNRTNLKKLGFDYPQVASDPNPIRPAVPAETVPPVERTPPITRTPPPADPPTGTPGSRPPERGIPIPNKPAPGTPADPVRPTGPTSIVTTGMQPLTVGQALILPPASALLLTENEVISQSITSFKTRLAKKSGWQQEKAIVGDQLHQHQELHDSTVVFAKHATSQMQPLLKDGLQVILKHITALEQLMDRLEAKKPA